MSPEAQAFDQWRAAILLLNTHDPRTFAAGSALLLRSTWEWRA